MKLGNSHIRSYQSGRKCKDRSVFIYTPKCGLYFRPRVYALIYIYIYIHIYTKPYTSKYIHIQYMRCVACGNGPCSRGCFFLPLPSNNQPRCLPLDLDVFDAWHWILAGRRGTTRNSNSCGSQCEAFVLAEGPEKKKRGPQKVSCVWRGTQNSYE